jgi:Xaa-Pro aminopeptidase
MEWISTAQRELKRQRLAGWLIYDFRGSNPLAKRFLSLGPGMLSRRLFLFVPPEGRPVLLVHAIEKGSLEGLPFEVRTYSSRQSLVTQLRALLPKGEVALEYSPMADIPYVSHVDAGTVDLVRSLGVTPVSSANLLQAFSAWSPEQVSDHLEAAAHVMKAKDLAFEFIAQEVAAGRKPREAEVQGVIVDYFVSQGLDYDHPPIVGFGPNSGDPHYAPVAGRDRELTQGEAILIDLWCKKPKESAPFADITWMGACGEPSPELQSVFTVVKEARELAVTTIRTAYDEGRYPQGRMIDRAVRDFIAGKGYGEAFTHRTGHSLGTRFVHGDAAHLDDFETSDSRELRPGLAVTVEPGIYLAGFGVRSEVNVVLEERGPRVTTGRQDELVVVASS